MRIVNVHNKLLAVVSVFIEIFHLTALNPVGVGR
jgi:hypothetical protein